MICLRSASLRPPQTPKGSRMRKAYCRQGLLTEHVAHMAFASRSLDSFSSFFSKCVGGKKSSDCGPRHAAFTCQESSTFLALTGRSPYDVSRHSNGRIPIQQEVNSKFLCKILTDLFTQIRPDSFELITDVMIVNNCDRTTPEGVCAVLFFTVLVHSDAYGMRGYNVQA